MSFSQNKDRLIVGVAACVLSSASIAGLIYSALRAGDAHSMQLRHWLIFLSVTGIAGGALLGWAMRRLKKLADRAADLQSQMQNHKNASAELDRRVKDLELASQLSRRSKRNTEAIIYSIRDAVVVIDESDRIIVANEAAQQLLGFDHHRSETLISELAAATEEASTKKFAEFLIQSRRSRCAGARREIDFVFDDHQRIYDCTVSCVYDEREKVCGVVGILHDITREKEISAMKNDFVSHVSHELKTPLSSITAYSEMLADGEAQDEQTRREFYSVIQTQAQRLNRLIEDILNISRIESGLIKVDKKPVSLTILIQEQLSMIRSFASEKNIEVIGQQPIVFDQAEVDRDMLSQVIINLLSNAVKYTPAGGTVEIKTDVDEHQQLVRVEVIDNGVGIGKEDFEHVFDKFYRVKKNNSQAKGTGLGLNLVKQIVEKVHNGRMFALSEPGLGSTFGFELPLAKAQAVPVSSR